MSAAMQLVAKAGSVDAAALVLLEGGEITEDEATESALFAASKLIETAPMELQGSFALVCQYHQFQFMSREALRRGDIRTALSAQKEISSLIGMVQ